MQPRQYLQFVRRWAWLVVVGLVIGGGIGWGYSLSQTPVYQARTKVLVMRAPESTLTDIFFQNDQQLAQTFTELLVTRPVLEATSTELGYRVFSSQVRVQRVKDAQLIQVIVEDPNPQNAADIANKLVVVFLQQNEKMQTSRFATSEESLQAQIQQVESQIADLQGQLSQASVQSQEERLQSVTDIIANVQAETTRLQEEIITLNYVEDLVPGINLDGQRILVTPTPTLKELIDVNSKQERLKELQMLLEIYQRIYVDLSFSVDTGGTIGGNNNDQIQAALVLYQQIYNNLLSNYESIRLARLQSTPNIVQVEDAQPATNPIRPNTTNNILLGGVIGLALAGAVSFLIEYLDETIRDAETVMEKLELPVLGYIGDMGKKNGKLLSPFVIEQPRSPISEAFRILRNNLEFTALDNPLKSILVTSCGVGEGKTTLAVNLALVLAQTGKRVVLVDADLRRPQVHEYFQIANRIGLSDLLRERADIKNVITVIQPSNLDVITSGSLPPNPAEVLGSEKMAKILKELADNYDNIILDGVPFLLADASILSTRVDGVLVVVRSRVTQQSTAAEMVEQLDRAGARIIGVVINWVKDGNGMPYSSALKGYSHYAYFKEKPETEEIKD